MVEVNIDKKQYCANCNAELAGKYCHRCGQANVDKDRYSLKNIGAQAFHDITDIDSKFIKSTRLLITRPGFLSQEFFNGRRQRYFSPIKLYMIFSVIYFIVYSFFTEKNMFAAESIYYTEFTGTAKAFIENKISAQNIERGSLMDRYNTIVSYTLYLVVVVFAVLFSLIFFNLRKYFAEHLIFSLHLLAFVFFIDVVFLPLYLYFDNMHFRIWGFLLVTSLYGVVAVREFYRQSLMRAAVLVFTFATLFWVAAMVIAFTTLYVLALTL